MTIFEWKRPKLGKISQKKCKFACYIQFNVYALSKQIYPSFCERKLKLQNNRYPWFSINALKIGSLI